MGRLLIFILFFTVVDFSTGAVKRGNSVTPKAKSRVPATTEKPFVQSASRFLKFTYGDKDPLGPSNWINLEDGRWTTNACDDIWKTPLNIRTSLAGAHERIKFQEEFGEDEEFVKSISFQFNKDIHLKEWPLGYPDDSFHGLVVRAPSTTNFQLLDRFDPVKPENEHILFDFAFASIHYCDLNEHPNRSMHQLDGKKYPFEFDMFFFENLPDMGIDKYFIDKKIGILVAILGEIGDSTDNPRLEPLIRAAKRFRGPKEFNLDDIGFLRLETTVEDILPPWSPTWLIPDVSSYYYYNEGSFPVPPCYSIARVYVIKEPIRMSPRQWKILTNVRSERERSKKLECTFSVAQHEIDAVRYNSNEYDFVGNDFRPMSSADQTKVNARKERDEKERKRVETLRKGKDDK